MEKTLALIFFELCKAQTGTKSVSLKQLNTPMTGLCTCPADGFNNSGKCTSNDTFNKNAVYGNSINGERLFFKPQA